MERRSSDAWDCEPGVSYYYLERSVDEIVSEFSFLMLTMVALIATPRRSVHLIATGTG
jgi:hypothetical protein